MRAWLIRVSMLAVAVGMLSVLMAPMHAHALDVPPAPASSPVVDQTQTLSADQIAELNAIIADERKATGNQIAILMIPSLEGEVLEEYSLEVARGWGIGAKDRDSGVLLLIAKEDRKLRIEVGYGLEGALTDIRSNQIIRQRITPAFQKGDYFAGIKAGLEGIVAAIHGEADPQLTQAVDDKEPSHFPWEFLFAFGLMGFSWLGAVLGRTKSWWAGGVVGGVIGVIIGFIFGFLFVGVVSMIVLVVLGLLFDKMVSANYRSHANHGDAPSWWAGGPFIGGGRSGGGGFGGFGGGSFGGGGASGNW